MRFWRKQTSAASPYGSMAAWVFLSFLIFYLGLTRGHFCVTDEIAVYHQTRSLWERGDLSTASVLHTLPGRGGKTYAPYGAGQSILALPLYGLGKGMHSLLNAAGAQSWIQTFAGAPIGDDPEKRWGGDIEIFFVNLFNSIAMAALAAVFFAFNLRLDVSPKWALIATVLFGLTSHIAGFSGVFFQHNAESLFLLWSFYFLFCDSQNPGWQPRALAGAAAGVMMLVRVSTLADLPVLALYLAWNVWKRTSQNQAIRIRQGTRELMQFAIPVAAGLLGMCVVNYAKFELFNLSGSYSRMVPLNNPLLVGLYGFLFSVGESIFLFTPLLFLAPWYLTAFARRRRAETLAILGLALASLLFYSKAHMWHGQWSFGPRYLAHIVPLLLLPLGSWLQELKPLEWIAPGLLGLAGAWMQSLNWLVNYSFVYHKENYPNFQPEFGYLFLPEVSQIPAHWRALAAWDYCVDFWLLNVYRTFGAGRLLAFAVPLGLLLAFCIAKVFRGYAATIAAGRKKIAPSFASGVPDAVYYVGLVWCLLIVLVLLGL